MPLVTPSILAYCKFSSDKEVMVGWVDYMSGRVGNKIKFRDSEEWWTVEEVISRFPKKMVFDAPMECEKVFTP